VIILVTVLAVAAYVAGGAVTFHLAKYWAWQYLRQMFPKLYDNRDYEHRDAPHDYGWALYCALIWPVGLPLSALANGQTRWHKRWHARNKARWEQARAATGGK
jgi:hypothetical protein